MKFISAGDMDFQFEKAIKRNNSFGNFIIPVSQMQYFEFYTNDGVSIQSEDFYLQKLTYSQVTGEESFYDYLQLNNTYKGTGYFSDYDFASSIDTGCYRIRAGNYYGVTLVYAKSISTGAYIALIDNVGDELIDNTSDPLIEL